MTSRICLVAALAVGLTACRPPVVTEPGQAVTLDRAWQVQLHYDPLNEPVLEGDTFYVPETYGAAAVDLASGTLKWSSSLPDDFYTWGDLLVG